MSFLNIEIKAKCKDPGFIQNFLVQHNADFRGIDYQQDTYFQVAAGRLKLRQGNIENNLIYYQRDNQSGPKSSYFDLLPVTDPHTLKSILTKSLGIKVVVEKSRQIYFIENVKFHLDAVSGLGDFVEIEASNIYADLSKDSLLAQCNYYKDAFDISEKDLIAVSYSDMLLAKNNLLD